MSNVFKNSKKCITNPGSSPGTRVVRSQISTKNIFLKFQPGTTSSFSISYVKTREENFRGTKLFCLSIKKNCPVLICPSNFNVISPLTVRQKAAAHYSTDTTGHRLRKSKRYSRERERDLPQRSKAMGG